MKALAAAAAAFVLSSAVHAAEPVVATPAKEQLKFLESKDPQLAANKKLVWDMWRTFLSAHHIDEADKYLAPEYHQHNPNAETGLAGVKAYFKARNLPAIDVPDHIEGLISMVAERDLVTLALAREYKDKDGKPYTTTWFDMFRIANGKIVEHWDTALKQ